MTSKENCLNNSYSSIYDINIVKYLEKEFKRLKGNYYFDHAGATLYSKTQMENVSNDLCSAIYGNPHSLGTASKLTLDIIDQIRFRLLDHFHTNSDEYSVIFTSGATDSIKILSNTFKFSSDDKSGGNFVYLDDNHTSILGMRELVLKKGAKVYCLKQEKAFDIFNEKHFKNSNGHSEFINNKYNSLFVYPAESNFNGFKYPLDWIDANRKYHPLETLVENNSRSNWFTLLDAAAFIPANDLNLSIYTPDFVCLSFYKIFGYPTGLGALLVKKSAEICLEKIYYGGGTVEIALSTEIFHSKRPVLHERFEDGTLPFLSIISLRHGFDILEKIPMEKISIHVFSLAKYLHDSLLSLHHGNGLPLANLYGDTDYQDYKNQGGIVSFNLLRSNGENIGFIEFLNIANLHNIHIRTGCFCNPGACQRHLKLSNLQLKEHFHFGHVCGDERDIVNGKPTGGIRVSFGYMSKISDVRYLLNVIKKSFLNGPEIIKIPDWWEAYKIQLKNKYNGFDNEAKNENLGTLYSNNKKDCSDKISLTADENSAEICPIGKPFRLKKLFIYPVKSCGNYEITDSWIMGDKGLAYDREWMITTASGVCLTQKQEIKLCLIKPKIREAENLLELSYPGMPSINIPLKFNSDKIKTGAIRRSKICGHRVQGIDCGSDVSEWLSLTLGRPGLRLVKQNGGSNNSRVNETPEISFSSQSQYLLINQSSIKWLEEKIPLNSECDKNTILDRFRGNIVVKGGEPFEEMKWSTVIIGKTKFQVDGQCTRCQMICIDQNTAETTIEPLRTLAEEFHGKLRFGIYLSRKTNENVYLNIGDKVFYR